MRPREEAVTRRFLDSLLYVPISHAAAVLTAGDYTVRWITSGLPTMWAQSE